MVTNVVECMSSKAWWLNSSKMVEQQQDDWTAARWLNSSKMVEQQQDGWTAARWLNSSKMVEHQQDGWTAARWLNSSKMVEQQQDGWTAAMVALLNVWVRLCWADWASIEFGVDVALKSYSWTFDRVVVIVINVVVKSPALYSFPSSTIISQFATSPPTQSINDAWCSHAFPHSLGLDNDVYKWICMKIYRCLMHELKNIFNVQSATIEVAIEMTCEDYTSLCIHSSNLPA